MKITQIWKLFTVHWSFCWSLGVFDAMKCNSICSRIIIAPASVVTLKPWSCPVFVYHPYEYATSYCCKWAHMTEHWFWWYEHKSFMNSQKTIGYTASSWSNFWFNEIRCVFHGCIVPQHWKWCILFKSTYKKVWCMIMQGYSLYHVIHRVVHCYYNWSSTHTYMSQYAKLFNIQQGQKYMQLRSVWTYMVIGIK